MNFKTISNPVFKNLMQMLSSVEKIAFYLKLQGHELM